MSEIRTFPYRREVRPAVAEGLGEFVDREYAKIEVVIASYEQRLASLEARLAAAHL